MVFSAKLCFAMSADMSFSTVWKVVFILYECTKFINGQGSLKKICTVFVHGSYMEILLGPFKINSFVG